MADIGDALAAQAAHPDSPSTPGTRVLERSTSVLGGYHPSRIPTRTIRDRLQIGTKTALTSTEWISGLRIARRGAQAGVAPPATGSSRRRSGGGLQNAEIAFLGDWYKLETPWPLDRPSQTHLGASARAPADCRIWGFWEGGGKQRLRTGSWPLRAPSAAPALGWAPWVGVRPPMHTDLPRKQNWPFRAPRANSSRAGSPSIRAGTVLGLTGVLGGILACTLG